MKRKKMHKSTDSKVFRRTAVNAKKINIDPQPRRGGIKL